MKKQWKIILGIVLIVLTIIWIRAGIINIKMIINQNYLWESFWTKNQLIAWVCFYFTAAALSLVFGLSLIYRWHKSLKLQGD